MLRNTDELRALRALVKAALADLYRSDAYRPGQHFWKAWQLEAQLKLSRAVAALASGGLLMPNPWDLSLYTFSMSTSKPPVPSDDDDWTITHNY